MNWKAKKSAFSSESSETRCSATLGSRELEVAACHDGQELSNAVPRSVTSDVLNSYTIILLPFIVDQGRTPDAEAKKYLKKKNPTERSQFYEVFISLPDRRRNGRRKDMNTASKKAASPLPFRFKAAPIALMANELHQAAMRERAPQKDKISAENGSL